MDGFLRNENDFELESLTIGGARRRPVFVDAFAGCGGLSLGLMKAGWDGLFAIEKDKFAFETLQENFLLEGARHSYNWPSWLPKLPMAIDTLIGSHHTQLKNLRGKVDLLAGGPPCQGFSSAGRRDPDDPRNQLVTSYLELVQLLCPDMVLLENVRGITYDFSSSNDSPATNYAEHLISVLEQDYIVSTRLLKAPSYGIPQARPRFFLIGLRKGVDRHWPQKDPFTHIRRSKKEFLAARGLKPNTAARAAISDLELGRNGQIDCPDSKGYHAIGYRQPKTAFQRLMRDGFEDQPTDTRLAKHRPHIVTRFEEIIAMCIEEGRLNKTISKKIRQRFSLKKQAIRVMDPLKPAPTVTSMPDDLLHYKEPRTLTVRENARLQTFPDWFTFKGKYTSGGDRRRREVPRFTQVANAVPPLIAEIIGEALLDYAPVACKRQRR